MKKTKKDIALYTLSGMLAAPSEQTTTTNQPPNRLKAGSGDNNNNNKMTNENTIAEIEQQLPRPAKIDSANRTLVRRWLTAHGVPYAMAGKLTVEQLGNIYNEPDAGTRAVVMSDMINSNEANNATPPAAPVAVAAPAPLPSGDALAALGSALAALVPAPAIDADAVRRIVREEAGIAPIRVKIESAHHGEIDAGIQHRAFPSLMRKIGAGCNVWLAGPAGTGKTTAAHNVAKALGLPFYFNGAIDSEHKLLGFTDAQGRIVSRPFREAYQNGGVYLFDEVDASLPAALLAFNAALANGHCDFPDGMIEKHADFRCIAAANTYGHGATHDYVGRAKMDAAFIDRFVALDWPTDEALERSLALSRIEDQAKGGQWVSHVQQCRANVKRLGLKVVVSPRASIHGCMLLQAGETWEDAETACIRKGMPDEAWLSVSGRK